MRRLTPALLILLAAVACRSHKTAENALASTEASHHTQVFHRDTICRRVVLRIDSPQLVVECLDSPRRRITVTAARTVVRNISEAGSITHEAVADTVATFSSQARQQESAPSVSSPAGWLRSMLAIAVAVAIALSFAKIRSRQ